MTGRRLRHIHDNRRRGGAAVEAALLAPLLIIVTMGAIDIGQFINVTQTLSNASRIGSRQACRNGCTDTTHVENEVHEYIAQSFPQLDPGDLSAAVQVSVHHADGSSISGGDLDSLESGDQLFVRVSLDFSTVRWMGALDFWDLLLEPVESHSRRE